MDYLDRAPDAARAAAASARTAALLAGRAVDVEGLGAPLGVGDRIRLVAYAPEDPENTRIELTWELTGTGHGLRTRAQATAPSRRSRAAALRARDRAVAGEPEPVRPLRPLPVRSALAQLAEPLTARRPPGPCVCCRRAAPAEAQLDRTPAGLCYGCETWHTGARAAQVPDPACAHTHTYSSVDGAGPRWWRQDPRTDPDPEGNPLSLPAFRAAGLDVQVGGTGGFQAIWWESDKYWVEATQDFDTGRWKASRQSHPANLGYGHPKVKKVRWKLRDDIALHELVAVLAALAAGDATCPVDLSR